MKEKTIYEIRLCAYADHLASIKEHPEEGIFETAVLVSIEGNVRIPFDIIYPIFLFEELVAAFPDDWGFNGKHGEPRLENSDPRGCTLSDAIDFFNLNLDETVHLFDVSPMGFQNVEKFGGATLNKKSKCADFARNFIELVKARIEE
jgi:hypothetical protein